MTKMYKILFTTMLFGSTMISISAYSWFGMWLGLEINLLSIIPLMQLKKSILSAESAVKYFTVQALASTIIMASIVFMTIKTGLTSKIHTQSSFLLMMNSALLTKMGTAPFHFWFPEVLEGLDWMNCLLILTWQKIAPMILMMYNMNFNSLMMVVIITSMVVSGIVGINQISLRKILAYSSINHMGWMLSTMMTMETIWLVYFTVYSATTLNLVMILNKFKIFFLNQLHMSMNNSVPIKLWFVLNLLSMGGIPPFLGFLPKWLTIQTLVDSSMLMLPVVMIIFTLITIFMYMRIAMSTLLFNTSIKNWTKIDHSIKSSTLAVINFFSISSLILVTLGFNLY